MDLCGYCECALVGVATLGPSANTNEGGGENTGSSKHCTALKQEKKPGTQRKIKLDERRNGLLL